MKLDIFDIVESNNVDLLKQYINKGYSVDLQDDLGCSPLYEAIGYENVEIVRLLLDSGANPNLPEVNGITPLMHAASSDNEDLDLINMLIASGVNILAKDKFGDSAMHYAYNQENYKICRLLIDKLEAGQNERNVK